MKEATVALGESKKRNISQAARRSKKPTAGQGGGKTNRWEDEEKNREKQMKKWIVSKRVLPLWGDIIIQYSVNGINRKRTSFAPKPMTTEMAPQKRSPQEETSQKSQRNYISKMVNGMIRVRPHQ